MSQIMLELVLAKLKVVIYQLAIIMLFDIYIALGEAATNAKGICYCCNGLQTIS
jgi:hypothetical protein